MGLWDGIVGLWNGDCGVVELRLWDCGMGVVGLQGDDACGVCVRRPNCTLLLAR